MHLAASEANHLEPEGCCLLCHMYLTDTYCNLFEPLHPALARFITPVMLNQFTMLASRPKARLQELVVCKGDICQCLWLSSS